MPPQEKRTFRDFLYQNPNLPPVERKQGVTFRDFMIPNPTKPEYPQVEGTMGRVVSTLSPVIDFLSRGQYASAKFFDSMMDQSKSIFDATLDSLYEFKDAKYKLSYSDIIKKHAPEFAKNNPTATSVLGFVGDVALDPTTYLGIGFAKNGFRVGGKVLTKFGEESLGKGIGKASKAVFVAKDGTLELIQKLAKKTDVDLPTNYNVKITKPSPILDDITELNQRGYFGEVQRKSDEVSEFYKSIGKQVPPEFAESIGTSETLKDLKRAGQKGLSSELFSSEVRERIESRIQKLTNLDPTFAKQLLADPKKGLHLKIGIPFGPQTDVLKVLGLDNFVNNVESVNSYLKKIPVIKLGAKAIEKTFELANIGFNKNYGLPEWYVQAKDKLFAAKDSAVGDIIRDANKIFDAKKIPKDRREVIGEVMSTIDDESRIMEDTLRKQSVQELESMKAAGIATKADETLSIDQESYNKIVDSVTKRYKLTPDEFASISLLRADYARVAMLEKEAELLKQGLVNYSPRGYVVTNDSDDFTFITKGKYTISPPAVYLPSSKQRKYMTKLEAEAEGLVPELDAAVLYAHRMLLSKRALSMKEFADSVEGVLGTKLSPDFARTGILPTTQLPLNVPKRILEDLRFLGDSAYPAGWSSATKEVIGAMDYLQTNFKRLATTYKPTFAAKQLISNTLQGAMVLGIKAFKAFDPRSAMDAGLIMLDRKNAPKQLPDFLNNFISKHFTGNQGADAVLAQRMVLSHITGEARLADYSKDMMVRGNFGQQYTGDEIVNLVRKLNVARDYDVTGDMFTRRLEKELTFDVTSHKDVIKEMSKFWKYAGYVEDYSRVMGFINGLRLGYSPEESLKLVNKAFFDYSRGATRFEKNVMRRIVPFYTYTSKAIPLVLSTSFRQPANITTMEKAFDTFNKLFVSGETLNESERETLLGNAVLEQGHRLKGFDKDGKAVFNVFNNITPLEVLNFFVEDDNGSVDIERSVQKSFLAMLTPYIKVPLEFIVGQNFFTGRTLADAGTIGDLSGIGNVLPEYVKDAISWEDRTNMLTGKTTTYINPYISYTMTNAFPAIRGYIKPIPETESPTEGALDVVLNYFISLGDITSDIKIDLKQQQQFKSLKFSSKVNDLVYKIKQSKIRGSELEFDRYKRELDELLLAFRSNEQTRTGFAVRGQGLGPQNAPKIQGLNLPIEEPQAEQELEQ